MYSDDELLSDLRRLADDLERTPRTRDVQEHGKYSHTVYYDRFDSWSEALEAAGLDTAQDHRYSKEELLAEIRSLADESGEPPTIADLRERGDYSIKPYRERFGSWNAAVEAAGFESRPSTSAVSKSALIEELCRIADEVRGTPTLEDVRERGTYSASTYIEKFGSWQGARAAAGLPTDLDDTLAEEELLEEVRRLAEELGHPPTSQDMRDKGDFSQSAYYTKFAGWNEVLDAAGFDADYHQPRISDEELQNELQRLADDQGEPPTLQELREEGEYAATTYIERFGSWQAALETAGYQPREPESKISEEELLAELRRLGEELEKRPTVTEMNEHGKYWVSTYRRHFGSWSDALEAAGFDEVSSRARVSREELLEELRRLEDEYGERPTMSTMREEGRYSTSTYARRFGSWSSALEAAGLDSRSRST